MDRKDLRILLWDIDGTILRSAKVTTFTEYTRPVLETVFGTAGRIDEVPLTGMTDLQYIAESLGCEGITREAIFERIGEISARYFCEIERAASNGAEFHVLPGVRDALEAVSQHPRYRSAVLTGNFETTARYKLNLVDLSDYFDLPGAYGDHSFDRPPKARSATNQVSPER